MLRYAELIGDQIAKSRQSVTQNCNGILYNPHSKKQKAFLVKCIEINVEEQRPFTFMDFRELTPENFRQKVMKSRKVIEVILRSPHCFYKIKGVTLDTPYCSRTVTYEGMEVGLGILPLLENLKEQPAAIHNLKFKFDTPEQFHEPLRSNHPMNMNNHGIELKFDFGDKIEAKIMIYPKTVVIDVACTFKPFIYDTASVSSMIRRIGGLYEYLLRLSYFKVEIPPPEKWIVTQYHFGKDSIQEIADRKFHYTWNEVSNGMIRYYTKKFPDGKVILRVEKIVTPNKPLEEVFSKISECQITADSNDLNNVIDKVIENERAQEIIDKTRGSKNE
jgi:hypothetical protein